MTTKPKPTNAVKKAQCSCCASALKSEAIGYHCSHCAFSQPNSPKPSAGKAEWEGYIEKIINYWFREYLSTPKTNDRYEALLEMNEPRMIKDIIGVIHQIIASELAREKEELAGEIEGMKKKLKESVDPRNDPIGTSEAFTELGYNQALAEAAKKVRER